MDKTQLKLKKIEGQVVGIGKMYDEKRDCLEIVQQIAAAKSALSAVARDLLTSEASRCARSQKSEELDRVLAKLLEL